MNTKYKTIDGCFLFDFKYLEDIRYRIDLDVNTKLYGVRRSAKHSI
jgi:hypothetical protein